MSYRRKIARHSKDKSDVKFLWSLMCTGKLDGKSWRDIKNEYAWFHHYKKKEFRERLRGIRTSADEDKQLYSGKILFPNCFCIFHRSYSDKLSNFYFYIAREGLHPACSEDINLSSVKKPSPLSSTDGTSFATYLSLDHAVQTSFIPLYYFTQTEALTEHIHKSVVINLPSDT